LSGVTLGQSRLTQQLILPVIARDRGDLYFAFAEQSASAKDIR
jgi:hypothetical protein